MRLFTYLLSRHGRNKLLESCDPNLWIVDRAVEPRQHHRVLVADGHESERISRMSVLRVPIFFSSFI
jgi:hypothetical protein